VALQGKPGTRVKVFFRDLDGNKLNVNCSQKREKSNGTVDEDRALATPLRFVASLEKAYQAFLLLRSAWQAILQVAEAFGFIKE